MIMSIVKVTGKPLQIIVKCNDARHEGDNIVLKPPGYLRFG